MKTRQQSGIIPAPESSNTPSFTPDEAWLAPMAGYTDLPFRILCGNFGASVCETEMISARALTMRCEAALSLLDTSSREKCVIPQLFGSDKDFVVEAVKLLMQSGWKAIDFNMGCPAKKVVRQGAGSALLADKANAIDLAKAVLEMANRIDNECQTGEKALLGFKIRLGFEKGKSVLPDLPLYLEDAGAAWITLHPRYGKDIFTGRADWDEIAKLKTRLAIPLIASGDLFTAEAGISCLRETGANAVMYARGALKNPAIFREHKVLFENGDVSKNGAIGIVEMIKLHIEAGRKYYSSPRGFFKLRSILPRYVRHLPQVGQLRQNLLHCMDWDALLTEVDNFMRGISRDAVS